MQQNISASAWFSNPHGIEVESKIYQAWRLKQELAGSRYPLAERLRLFHGMVIPTVLYGYEAWTMTGELENRLRRTQRQMLRMIFHAPQRLTNTTHDEPDHQHRKPQQQAPDPPRDRHLAATVTTKSGNDSDEGDNDDDGDVDSTTSTPPPPNHNNAKDDYLEPWADCVRQCSHDVGTRKRKLEPDDWITMQPRRRWGWLAQ